MLPERLRIPRLSAAVLVITALTLAGGGANGPVLVKYYNETNSYDLAAIGYPGPQARIVHGDPFGDLTGAMFFNVDRELLWSAMPYTLTSVSEVAPGYIVNDMVMQRDSTDEMDLCLFTDASGLHYAQYDATNNGFTLAAVPGASAWADAKQLRRRVVDGDEVVSGVLTDGKTVRVSEIDETGEALKFSFTSPLPVLSYDLYDVDGDGELDVGVVTTIGLYIFDRDGPLLRREAVALTDGGAETFGNVDRARMAFWYTNDDTTSALLVIDGATTEPEIPLTVVGPWGNTLDVVPSFMTSGDFDADSYVDLFLQIHHQFGVMLENQADPVAHFDVVNFGYDVLPLSSTPEATANPGVGFAYFGNIDGDLGDDLLIPADWLDFIFVYTREGLLSQSQQNQVGRGSGDLVAIESTYGWTGVPVDAHFNMAFDIPPDMLPSSPTGYQHVQVLSWFQRGIGQNLFTLAEQNNLYELQYDNPNQWVKVVPTEGTVMLQNAHWPMQDNIWVVFRFVDANTTEQPPKIQRAGRFMVGAFTLQAQLGEGIIPPYLLELEGAGIQVGLDLQELPHDNGGAPQATNYVGAWVPQSSTVLFPDAPQMPPLFGTGELLGSY
jgi:hypothetical protein